MNKSFLQQAHKESLWAFIATLMYLIFWVICAYLPPNLIPNTNGIIGFPLWFELSCIYMPIIFIFFAYLIIKKIYKDIPLD